MISAPGVFRARQRIPRTLHHAARALVWVERAGFAEVRTFRDRFRITWPGGERELRRGGQARGRAGGV